jgi:hypothetical protein
MWARITTSKNWNINGYPDKYLILKYQWIHLTYAFRYSLNSYILLTFHIKNSDTSREVFCKNVFKQTWCTSRYLGTSGSTIKGLLYAPENPKERKKGMLSKQHTWTHFQNNFQAVATPTQPTIDASMHLLTQDISRAGTYHDWSTAKLVTISITIELEIACMTTLRYRIKELHPWGHNECNAWESWQRTTAIPFHSPLDNIRYQENDCFHMTIARYLGQPCPIIALLVGQYFGWSQTWPIQSEPSIWTTTWTRIYSATQYTTNLTHPSRYDEDRQLRLNDRSGQLPYQNSQTAIHWWLCQPHHKSTRPPQECPRCHCTWPPHKKYPTVIQIVNDSRASRSAKAIFEIKTFTNSM